MWWTEKSIKTEQEKLKAQSKRKKNQRKLYIITTHCKQKYKPTNCECKLYIYQRKVCETNDVV